MTKHVSQAQAILLALLCFTMWNFYDACLKAAGDNQIPVHEVLGITGLLSMLMLAVVNAARGQTKNLKPKNTKLVALRAALCAGIQVCNITALPLLPLTDFYILVFTSPFIIAILATIFLREPLPWQKALAIFVGFIGVIIAINPASLISGTGETLGYIAALGGVILFAITQIMLRPMAQTETPDSLIFANKTIFTISGCSLLLWSFKSFSWEMGLILLLAAFVSTIGDILMVFAMKHAPAATIAPCQYWQIIPGALISYFIWHDQMSWNLVAGAAIIISAGIIMTHQVRERKAVVVS